MSEETVIQSPDKTAEELEKENAALRRQLETARSMVRDLATVAPINNRALQRQTNFIQRYDNPAKIAELEQLVYKMLPNAKQIGMKGAMLVARRALALGLDPFVEGNLWAYVDDGIIRVAIGYLGHRERIEAAGLKMLEPRAMTKEERARHGLRDQDHGAVVEVWDPHEKESCDKAGIPYRPVLGVGIWRPDERKTFVPVGRSGYWRAETRATNDAGKRAVRQTLDTLRWMQGISDVSVSQDGALWSIEGDPAAEWTKDETRKAKAAEKIAELDLTDDIVNQALGMEWSNTWMEPDDFFNFLILLADQRKGEAIEGVFTVRSEPAEELPAPPAIENSEAGTTEPPVASSPESTENGMKPESESTESLSAADIPSGDEEIPADPNDSKYVRWNTDYCLSWVTENFDDLKEGPHAYNAIKEAMDWESWKDAPKDYTTGQFKIDFPQKRAAVKSKKAAAKK